MVTAINPRQHAILGHYRPTSETQFKWSFAGGLLVVVFYMLTGVLLVEAVCFMRSFYNGNLVLTLRYGVSHF